MFCRKCGKKISDQVAYCNYCGTQTIFDQVNAKHSAVDLSYLPTTKKPGSQRRWGLWITTSIIAIVVLLAVLIGNHSKVALTVQEAQAKIDAALEDVYQEASSDNYIAQLLNGKVKITVNSIRSTEKGYLAECTVTSVDIATPILNYLLDLDKGTIDTYSNAVADLQKAITKADEIQQTFRVEFIQVNGEYKAMFPEEMVVFCSGNIQELLPKIDDILQGGTIE